MTQQRQLEGVTFDTKEPWLLSFSNLARAKTVTQAADEVPSFSINAETASESEINRAKAAIMEAAKELYPNGIDVIDNEGVSKHYTLAEAIKAGEFIMPLTNGDKLAEIAKNKAAQPGAKQRLRDWSRGKWVLGARTKEDKVPLLSVYENGKFVGIEDQAARTVAQGKHFYAGAKVLVVVWFRAYPPVGRDGKPGVKAYLNEVAKVGDGDRLFGEARTPGSRFTEYRGHSTDESVSGEETNW